jgi:hypothetical protein
VKTKDIRSICDMDTNSFRPLRSSHVESSLHILWDCVKIQANEIVVAANEF